ncbi:hypothetical protein ID866_7644 [Astraeus odoratus]|nr:hypothetical protein ID866_7644 [Astraeus odoratus]
MSTSSKNLMPINWKEVLDKDLGWSKADSKDVSLVKLQEKETLAQVVKRRMGEAVKDIWGLGEEVAQLVAAKYELVRVLYCGFQSMDIKIFGIKGYLPTLALKSEPKFRRLRRRSRN